MLADNVECVLTMMSCNYFADISRLLKRIQLAPYTGYYCREREREREIFSLTFLSLFCIIDVFITYTAVNILRLFLMYFKSVSVFFVLGCLLCAML